MFQKKNIMIADLNGATCLIQAEDIEFPLYARGLQFCSPNQDSFVRLTAMNILNVLHLSTVSSQLQHSSQENDSQAKATAETSSSSDNVIQSHFGEYRSTFRQRVSIACQPGRVEPFIGPIFRRLFHLRRTFVTCRRTNDG